MCGGKSVQLHDLSDRRTTSSNSRGVGNLEEADNPAQTTARTSISVAAVFPANLTSATSDGLLKL